MSLLEEISSERDPMATLSLRIPDSLHRQLKTLAEKVSINQLISTAVAEKVSAS